MSSDINPYATPQSAYYTLRKPSLSEPKGVMPPAPYRSARARAYLAAALAGAYLVVSILLAVSTLSQIELLKELAESKRRGRDSDAEWRQLVFGEQPQFRSPSEQELFDNDQRQRVLGIAHVAAGGVAVLFLLLWLYAAHRNLPALGVERPRFTPGWAVGYWFIPILNLIRPCQAILELAAGSDPGQSPARRKSGRRPKPQLLILIWWLWNVGGGIVAAALIFARMPSERPEIEGIISANRTMVTVLLAIYAPAIFLQILLILRIDRDQQNRSTLTIASTGR